MNHPANRLAQATSPYLKQHQYNPVDWYMWGPEALEKAKKENKPIFLSIGYSACHWCHVMEKESFENEEVSKLLNQYFVCIKVDREERPDLDEIYMSALQAMSGHGGWPMSIFLTPDLKPFFAGTYFPPENQYGRVGFKSLIQQLAEAWATQHERLLQAAEHVAHFVSEGFKDQKDLRGPLSLQLLDQLVVDCQHAFDPVWGGFGEAPKFPPTGPLLALMRAYRHHSNLAIFEMVMKTLDKMSQGGMYDQIGGGFHRYSVDEKWLVPHFEKMLYDNALLVQVYLNAYQLIKKPAYLTVATQTLDYILREMQNLQGGFYSSEDADSEGVEGKYYVWSKEEIIKEIGQKAGSLFCRFYGVTEHGNFEGENILFQPLPIEKATAEEQESLAKSCEHLRQVRAKRIHPGRDDKILTDWNSLMISSFAQAYQVTREPRYLEAARQAASFIREFLYHEGKLWHTWLGQKGTTPGFLDDYATYINALVDLYESSLENKWLEEAIRLTNEMIDRFWDESSHTFFNTADDHTDLLVRTKSFHDSATPSGNASASLALIRLSGLLGQGDYKQKARFILEAHAKMVERAGRWYGYTLVAIDAFLTPPSEIVLIGKKDSKKLKEFLHVIYSFYLPNKLVVHQDANQLNLPLLKGKGPVESDKPCVYLCHDFECLPPIYEASELKKALNRYRSSA